MCCLCALCAPLTLLCFALLCFGIGIELHTHTYVVGLITDPTSVHLILEDIDFAVDQPIDRWLFLLKNRLHNKYNEPVKEQKASSMHILPHRIQFLAAAAAIVICLLFGRLNVFFSSFSRYSSTIYLSPWMLLLPLLKAKGH